MTPLLLLALAAAPEAAHADKVAVLVVRRTSVTPDEGRAFAEAAAAVLKAAGVAVEDPAESLRRLGVLGVTDPNVCSGRKACVLELARQLEVGGIVAISAAALQQERSVVFEASRVADGSSLAKDAAVVKAGTPVLAEHLAAVSRALAAAFPRKADAPVVEKKAVEPVAPVPPPPSVIVETPPPLPPPEPEHSHTPTFVSGGVAAAALVTAVVLGVVAINARSQATRTMSVNGEMVSALPASRVKELAGEANGFGAGAGVAAGVAVALGVVAVVTW